MANTKKYVSLDKLGLYNEKIQEVIDVRAQSTLSIAQGYADSLAKNYDAAGSAATAESNAKTYTNGQISAVNTTVAGVKTIAEQGVSDAAVADGKAVKAQGDVDGLKAYVGTFTASEGVDTVVKYIDAKTANIASDETVSALANRVTQAEKDIDAIEADYLKAADKTELSNAINAEKERAVGIEGDLETRLAAVEGDYLKEEDRTALSDAIDAEKERAMGVEGGLDTRVQAIEDDYLKGADKTELQNQINLIMNNPDTKDVIDSISEFTQYIADHGEIAEGFRTDIDKNKEDIAALDKALGDHEALAAETYATKTELANEKKALQDEIDADVAVVAGKVTTLEGSVATKAEKSYVDEQVEALQGVDTGLGNRITALENKFGGAEGSVEDQIADAKQAAIDAAAGDATTKANKALDDAKTYANGLNTAMNTRVEALEAIDHDHSNKGVLDGITSDKVSGWDNASAKVHEHSNLSLLESLTATKVAAWEAAEQNAKTYADGLNTAMDTRVGALESWHNNFTEVSEAEIIAMFGK